MRIYYAFTDPSGGSSDSFTLAIAYRNLLGKVICAGFWERKPPFSPDSVVKELAETLKSYRCTKVVGDRYSGEWVRERFREHQIVYEASERTKSEIYISFVALVNSARVKLPADKRLRTQFASLERRTTRTAKEIVDHIGAHDDLANSVAGALVLAASSAKEKFFEPFTLRVERASRLAEDRDGDRFWHRQN